jgi:PmbA protein
MKMEKILDFSNLLLDTALKRGAGEAEVYYSASIARRLSYRDRELEGMETSRSLGFALRVNAGGGQGLAYLATEGEKNIERVVEEALSSARLGDEKAYAFSRDAGEVSFIEGLEDPNFHSRGEEEKRDLLQEQVEQAFAVSKLVQKVKKASYAEKQYRRGIVSSNGFSGLKGGTLFTLSASVLAGKNGDKEMAHEWTSGRLFNDLLSAGTAVEAAERAVGLLGGTPVETGAYPAVLHPSVASSFLSVFTSGLAGEMVARGKSPLKDRLGEEVAARGITIADDGLMPGGYLSEPFDDEGVKRSRRMVVEQGVLKGLFLNLKSAALLGMEPTGSGSRPDYKSHPGESGANLHITAGDRSLSDIISDLTRGLYITEVLGAHTMDPISGTVSLGASGLLIKSGRMTRPFRGVTMAGDLYELFRKVAQTGDDLRFYGGIGSPSLLMENVDVAGGTGDQ